MPPSPEPHTALDRDPFARQKQRAAAASVMAGLVLTVLKLAAGLATSSLGLLAEAAHSGLDLGAAVLTWLAVRTSWRPPDADHHYGHAKFENLAALGETLLLVGTSVWILTEAAERALVGGPEVEPTIWAFLVMGLSIVVDYYRARDLRRVARRSRSQALEADALHFSTDMVSSLVVIGGLVGVLVAARTGVTWLALADPMAASVVAVIVLVLSWRLGRRAVDILLDRAPAGMRLRLEKALGGLEELEAPPRIRIRQAGDRTFVDVDLPLRRGLPLAEGDRIAANARSRVRAAAGENSSVFVQFEASRDEEASLRERVATAVAMEGVQAHNITIRKTGDDCQADLHLELPGRLTLGRGHAVADRVEATVLKEVPELRRVDIHLELHDEEPEPAVPLDRTARAALEARVHQVARQIMGRHSVHDLMLSRTPAGLYLSCHCFLPSETPLAEAHALTDRLERALRQAVPGLTRVAVHAEPAEE